MKMGDFFRFLHKRSAKQSYDEKEWDYYSHEEVKKEFYQILGQMNRISRRFENETNFDLIEADIWEMKSLEARYRQILHEAKKMRPNGWEELWAGGTKE